MVEQPPKVNAASALKGVGSVATHTSASSALDRLIGGGFREGSLFEVFGRSGSGKTQLALQAALAGARGGTKVLFVDTEGTFRPERLLEMAEVRGWGTEGVLDRIVYARIDSSAEQAETVRGMESRHVTSGCRLVIVDTLTRNFSIDLPGRLSLGSRQAALDIHLSEMARDAYLNRRAYLLTNRVTFGPSHDVGIGGRTVEQLVHASVRLDREGDEVRLTVVGSGSNGLARLGRWGVD